MARVAKVAKNHKIKTALLPESVVCWEVWCDGKCRVTGSVV